MAAASPAQTPGHPTPQMSSSDARFASSLPESEGVKRDPKSAIWPSSEAAAQVVSGRELSPTFGGRGEDDSPTHNSPTSGGQMPLHANHSTTGATEIDEPHLLYIEVMGVKVNRLQARQDVS